MTVAAAAAAVWTLAAVAIIVLSYADTIGAPVSGSAEFTGQLGYYVTRLIPGQAWAVTAVAAALTTTLAVLVRSPAAVAANALVALAAVIPLSQLGHVAGVDDHNGAVNALALHLLGAGIWTGGIIVLALLVAAVVVALGVAVLSADEPTTSATYDPANPGPGGARATAEVLRDAGLQISLWPYPHTYPYVLNCAPGSVFSDVRVRQAMNFAIASP